MVYLSKLVIIFTVCSFFGWVMEVICGLNDLKRFVNRGYLIGPVCPIYGFGGLLFYFLLWNFRGDALRLAMYMMGVAAILEYATSYVMEKIFGVRYWDYSKQKLNLNGRICAEAIVLFGILGLVGVEIVFPMLFKLLGNVNDNVLLISAGILLTSFVVDLVISTVIVANRRKGDKSVKGDATEEMSLYVKGTILDLMVVDGISWNLPKIKIDFKKMFEKTR